MCSTHDLTLPPWKKLMRTYAENKLTAMSVAAENASGTTVDTKSGGAMTMAVAVKLTLFLPHHFLNPNRWSGVCHNSAFKNRTRNARKVITKKILNKTQSITYLEMERWENTCVEGEFSEILLSCSLKNSENPRRVPIIDVPTARREKASTMNETPPNLPLD